MLSSNLKELEVHYDGVWLDCPVKGIKYAGLSKFFVHNVDPNHMELAKLFQLVINESRNPKLKPIRAWYQQLNQPLLSAMKPLNTATDMRSMFQDMAANHKKRGVVYFQQRDQVVGPDGDSLYSLPQPLARVPIYDGIENLYQHAELIQRSMDIMNPTQLRYVNKGRPMPFVTYRDPEDATNP